jgi:hypothetical protein
MKKIKPKRSMAYFIEGMKNALSIFGTSSCSFLSLLLIRVLLSYKLMNPFKVTYYVLYMFY